MRGAVLAGGQASRFDGKAKGLEKVGAERIVDRVARAVEEATGSRPILIANAPHATAWCPGLQVVPDVLPGRGSLGGIYTAVTAGDGPVLVVAWDMPFVSVDLLQALVAGVNGYDVFLPESGGKRGLEPLCGVYGPACAGAIRGRLEQEDYRAIGFHDSVRVGTLALAAVAGHGDPEMLFYNVNTAQELAEAEAMWQRRA
ncbi:MAG TPA: molybdenum cofactor guanylyltransferase [Gemmatimonadales bacterium]